MGGDGCHRRAHAFRHRPIAGVSPLSQHGHGVAGRKHAARPVAVGHDHAADAHADHAAKRDGQRLRAGSRHHGPGHGAGDRAAGQFVKLRTKPGHVKRGQDAHRLPHGVDHGQPARRRGEHMAQRGAEPIGIRGNGHRVHDVPDRQLEGLPRLVNQHPGQAPGGDHAKGPPAVENQRLARPGREQTPGRLGRRSPQAKRQRRRRRQIAKQHLIQLGHLGSPPRSRRLAMPRRYGRTPPPGHPHCANPHAPRKSRRRAVRLHAPSAMHRNTPASAP